MHDYILSYMDQMQKGLDDRVNGQFKGINNAIDSID